MLQGYGHLLEKKGLGPDLLCGCADPPADLCEQVQGFGAKGPRCLYHDRDEVMGVTKDLILATLSQLVQSYDSLSLCYTLGQMGFCESVCAGNVPSEHAPDFHGAIVTPSGRLLSNLLRPVGSNVEGIWADDKALLTMSLIAAWRDWRSALFMQLRSWIACSSIGAPQSWQAWHSRTPRQRPTAILTTSLSMRRPRLDTGSAFMSWTHSWQPIRVWHGFCALGMGDVAGCALYSIHGHPPRLLGQECCKVFVGGSSWWGVNSQQQMPRRRMMQVVALRTLIPPLRTGKVAVTRLSHCSDWCWGQCCGWIEAPDQNPRDMVAGSMEPSLIMQTCRLSEAIKWLNNLKLVIICISF